MAKKNYKGYSGKSIWENEQFQKGMNYTDNALRNGTVKVLSNFDIGSMGSTLRPRSPIYNILFKTPDVTTPFSLKRYTYMFNSTQNNDKQYFISFEDKTSSAVKTTIFNSTTDIEDDRPYVIDGDTLAVGDIRYRLVGIDAPDEDAAYYEESKTKLKGFIDGANLIEIQYEKDEANGVDVYDRRLVWVFADDTNLNISMVASGLADLFGGYAPDKSTIHITRYSNGRAQNLIDSRTSAHTSSLKIWGTHTFKDVALYAPASSYIKILTKPLDAELQSYATATNEDEEPIITMPYLDVEDETYRINTSQVYQDLDLEYGVPFEIRLNNQEYSTDDEVFEYGDCNIPIVRADHEDGFAFMGTIEYQGEEVYSGLMTLSYFVPLDRNGSQVEWEKYSFKLRTYKDNVNEIPWDSSIYEKQNLLDQTPNKPESNYIAHGSDTTVDMIEIQNSDGQHVDQLKKGNSYTATARVTVPPMEGPDRDNFDGYAIKWEYYTGSKWRSVHYLGFQRGYFYEKDLTNSDKVRDTYVMTYDRDGRNIVESYTLDHDEYDEHGIVTSGPTDDYNYTIWVSQDFTTVYKEHWYFRRTDRLNITDKMIYDYGGVPSVQLRYTIYKAKKDANTDGIMVQEDESGGTSYFDSTWVSDIETIEDDVVLESENSIGPLAFRVSEHVVPYHNVLDLHQAKSITYFDGRIVLYGGNTGANAIYFSEWHQTDQFPWDYSHNQFHGDIVYAHPHNNMLIVFTTTNIYSLYERPPIEDPETGAITSAGLMSKLIYSNLTIKNVDRSTVKSIGKDIFFMAGNVGYLLRPNPYVENPHDMYIAPITEPISGILQNPTMYFTDRLQFYGVAGDIFSDSWKPIIHRNIHITGNKIWLYFSANMDDLNETFMIIFMFDLQARRWVSYDTKSCSFPYQFETFDATQGTHTLCRNHNTIDNGVTLMLRESLNLWDFDEGYGRFFDIKAVRLDSETGKFVINNQSSIDDIESTKMPINAYVDTGYMDVSPHLFKRFHKLHWELNNIDCQSLPISTEFRVDGKVRQTSNSVKLEQNKDPNSNLYGTVSEVYQYLPNVHQPNLYTNNNMGLKAWQLGMSKFGPLNRLKLNFGISGRGRVPSVKLAFKTTGLFELYKYGIIFKEQSAR